MGSAREKGHNLEKLKGRPSLVRVVEITPEEAIDLLDTNYEGQRRVKKQNVDKLVEVMRSGKWDPYVGDLIRVTRDGILIDGQHRLTAVVEAETPCESLYSDSYDIRDFPFVDTGLSRSAADVIGSVASGTETAALVKAILNWREFGLNYRRVFVAPHSNGVIAETYREIGCAVDEAVRGGRSIYEGLGVKGSRLGVSLFFYLANMVDPEALDKFSAASRDDTKMVIVRTFFLRAAAAGKKLGPQDIFSVLSTAWNDGLTGRARKVYRPNPGKIEMLGITTRWKSSWLERENELERTGR